MSGKVVAIVDDMISTEAQSVGQVMHWKDEGSGSMPYAHGLFLEALGLAQHVDGVHSTDSLENPRAVISGAPTLAKGVRDLLAILAIMPSLQCIYTGPVRRKAIAKE